MKFKSIIEQAYAQRSGVISLCRTLPVVILAVLSLFPQTVVAQSNATDAAMDGYVTDSSGAAVPNAHLTAKNVATNITSEATSDSNGYFRFPILKIGGYTLTTAASGFSDILQSGIVLSVGSEVRINVTMKLGLETDTVQVYANPSVLEASTAAIGATIDAKALRVLPLTRRKALMSKPLRSPKGICMS